MAALIEDYKTVAPEVTVTPTFGSSGTLQTQIEEGAPADLFLSAGKKQMTALADKNLLLTGTNTDLLENKVVLIVPKDSGANIASFEDLATDKVKVVALGEPTGVPVGQYSEKSLRHSLLDAVKAKPITHATCAGSDLGGKLRGGLRRGIRNRRKDVRSVKGVCPPPRRPCENISPRRPYRNLASRRGRPFRSISPGTRPPKYLKISASR
jgi:ABC-type molybdate transport system substrate-binding protein